ncbi:MAG TPA: hypothetical protein EYG92_08730 [Lutibacter sp.]|nr:hypothetical protein [Lutibacter sp.]
MLLKILQIIVFQGLFLFIYQLWLRKETFYTSNRIYLISTSLLAVMIPFISLNIVTENSIPTQIIALGEVVLNTQNLQLPEVILNANQSVSGFSIIMWFYFTGMLLSFSIFIWKLAKVSILIQSSKQQKKNGFVLIKIKDSTSVFSFLNYVFIGEKIIDKNPTYLIAHEKVHVRQKHSLDLLWFELLKIVLWFNPFVYVYQRQITALHEFIADAESIRISDTKTYYNHLLNDLFQVENMAFVNQFYNKSLIQKRITMMTKTQSPNWKMSKYFAIFPLLIMMFFIGATSAQESEDMRQKNFQNMFDFFEAHEDSRNLSLKQYTKYLELLLKVKPDKKIKSFESYKEAVKNSKDYHLYEVSHTDDTDTDSIVIKDLDRSVPFSIIDEVPIYPGCENIKDKAEQRECLSRKIQTHVAKNFNVDIAQNLGLSPGKKRIFTMFKIDKEGNITSVKSRAPHKDLELEAMRVILTLPKMIPGKQNGKVVEVKYSLPISFIVENDKNHIINEVQETKVIDSYSVPFSIIDEVPIYPGCENIEDKAEQRECLSRNIQEHVAKNFNVDMAQNLGLSPGKKRIFMMFKIDKEGNITSVNSRAPHKDLELEAMRVILTLPKMIPGKQNGKNVEVKYSLPISFIVQEKDTEKKK